MAKELSKVYEPKEVERSIYEMWEAGGYFHAEQDETKNRLPSLCRLPM